ncbi:MAG: hypothetical protein ACK4F5_07700 [Aliihoeflea sp.]|jgi:hypothetical protein
MLFRLSVVVLVIVAFAGGFAELVDRAEDPADMQRMSNPCEDWGNPACQQIPLQR